jgi:hypothetical protein
MFLAQAADRLYSETCPVIPSKDLQKKHRPEEYDERHFTTSFYR